MITRPPIPWKTSVVLWIAVASGHVWSQDTDSLSQDTAAAQAGLAPAESAIATPEAAPRQEESVNKAAEELRSGLSGWIGFPPTGSRIYGGTLAEFAFSFGARGPSYHYHEKGGYMAMMILNAASQQGAQQRANETGKDQTYTVITDDNGLLGFNLDMHEDWVNGDIFVAFPQGRSWQGYIGLSIPHPSGLYGMLRLPATRWANLEAEVRYGSNGEGFHYLRWELATVANVTDRTFVRLQLIPQTQLGDKAGLQTTLGVRL